MPSRLRGWSVAVPTRVEARAFVSQLLFNHFVEQGLIQPLDEADQQVYRVSLSKLEPLSFDVSTVERVDMNHDHNALRVFTETDSILDIVICTLQHPSFEFGS